MKYEERYLETTIYSMFKGKSYDYKTIREGEIFLSYPKCFNDPFDCAIFIDKKAFEREFLVIKLGADLVAKIHFDTYVREFIEASFYKKHKQWEYENEYRLVINKNNNSFEKTLETPVGFRIKFPYLSKVYIHTDHIKHKNGIKSISNKLNKDIICLRESPQGVKLVEDKTLTHKYNDHRTLTHILSGYNETQILTTKDELPF